VLFLTKPLGTGLVLTGVKEGMLGASELAAAITQMTTLNGEAAGILRPHQPSAVTDVTGFGLFGHAIEVAERSDVRLTIEAKRLPALPGAMDAAGQGLRTGGDPRNREFAAGRIRAQGVAPELDLLGFDPQTAGGLLISLPADQGVVLEAEFRSRGLLLARIGSVDAGTGVHVV